MDFPEDHGITNEIIRLISVPVGEMILTFSLLENALRALHNELPDHVRARGLEDVIGALQWGCKNLPSFSRHSQLPGLLSRAKGVAKARHRFAHWTLAEFRERPSPALRFVKSEFPDSGDLVGFRDKWYTLREIFRFREEVVAIAHELWPPVLAIAQEAEDRRQRGE